MENKIVIPKANFIAVRKFIVIFLLIFVSFAGGYFLGVKGFKAQFKSFSDITVSRETPLNKNVNFSLFWQVWDILGNKYFDKTKLNAENMVYGAISGMVAAAGDPYTMFLPPTENKVVDEDLSGSFEGVGIEIGYRSTQLAVISPLAGSPAEKAGVKPGDYIVHIKDDDKKLDLSTSGMTLPDAVKAIRGKAGTKVTLTLVRDNVEKPIEAEITRAKLDVPSVTTKFVGKDKSIVHIRINKFTGDTVREWNSAVSEFLKNPEAKSIILDLRSDPGGYMQAAVDIASDFIPTGKVVVIEERGDGGRIEYKVERYGKLLKVPVIVLVNGGSASASEILAGALRDQRDIKLIGEKSFGKGTIQEPVEISGGSGLHVTVAKWLTPNGTWVHEKGLTPDTEVKDDEKTADIDEQLQKAIETLEKN